MAPAAGMFRARTPVVCGDLLAPGLARSRVGQALLPRLHLLHTAFLLTPLHSQFSPRPYPFQKLIPSSPTITKKGMDIEKGVQRRGCPCAPSSARQRGPGPVTKDR